MPGKSTTLTIRILADASQAAKTMSGASDTAGRFAGGLRKAMIPAIGITAALGAMGKSAAEDAQGQALLAQQLTRTAGATAAQVAATEDYISKTTLATGVADDQLRPALAAIARATGDVSTAQTAMATVLDVSAATGKDVESVATAVAKAYAGNTTALGRLVPGLSKAVVKSGDMNKIMAELATKTGGAAAAAADTAAGRWQRSQVAFSEAKEAVGAGLLPVLDRLTRVLATAGAWAANNAGAVTTLAVVLGTLAAAVMAVNAVMAVHTAVTNAAALATKLFSKEGLIARAATMAWAAAQWVLNAAMTANPIGLIVLAIVALAAAFVIAYKKSETFRRIVQGAWTGIRVAALAAWNFIKTYVILPYIAYVQMMWKAVQTAVGIIIAVWNTLKSAMAAVYTWIKTNVFDPMRAAFDAVVDAVKGVISWISKIKIPKAVQWLIDKGKVLVSSAARAVPAPLTVAPAPAVPRARGGLRAAPTVPATRTGSAALAALQASPEVIVQVSDRKMADLVDVKLRASATSAARDLTRRKVVTV